MEKCPICKNEVNEWDKPGYANHLIVTKNMKDDHIHVHGDLENKEVMKDLLKGAQNELGIYDSPGQKLDRKEVVFHNRQRIGDILTFTCAVRDFKAAFPDVRVNVISTAGHIWDHNPNIDRSLIPTDVNTVKIGPGWLTNASNRIDWHMCNAFRVSMEEHLKIHIPQGESRPDIYFTEEEYNAPRFFEQPYWIICTTGEKGWGTKMYPTIKWQKLVEMNPDITFVQIGSAGDNAPRLQGKNVIDYIGKTENRDTGIRDLFRMFLNAEGSIGLVSFHMHLSGALNKPCVVVAGGREPVSFTRYAGHAYLSTDGMLPCSIKACWHCSIDACTNLIQYPDGLEKKVPKCVDIIDVEDVHRALNNYYRGGRCVKGKPCEKPKIKNIVRGATPITTIQPVTNAPYGMVWGGGCITDRDWTFIQSVLAAHKIKSVLEFGCGLSTLLMSDAKLKVTSFETNPGWIAKIKAHKSSLDIQVWDGKTNPDITKLYDMAFVDGPAGGINREASTAIAANLANVVIVHDANREWERKWQEKYLVPYFDGPIKGGHRCHMWIRKDPNAPKVVINEKDIIKEPAIGTKNVIVNGAPDPYINVATEKKFIKIVSTARGWGGCGRSISTIMKFLIREGHKVEFVPFRNSIGSQEMKQYIKTHIPTLTVTENFDTIKEQCDVFFVYADDYVWEFGTPEMVNVFSDINAKKKIMMLNYRRGGVGTIPWTRNWDKYMFLNSTQEKELLGVHPGVKTKVLPPCTELAEFLKTQPDYGGKIRLIRHSSQGDSKFAKDCGKDISTILGEIPNSEILMMPGPSFVTSSVPRFQKFPKNIPPVPQFLGLGNLFYYSLEKGYMDMGPRVALEALAAGLPIIADNWGGMVDRVTPETGWLCNNKEEYIAILKTITPEILKKKGEAAKEYAYKHFRPEVWVSEIVE